MRAQEKDFFLNWLGACRKNIAHMMTDVREMNLPHSGAAEPEGGCDVQPGLGSSINGNKGGN